MNWSLFLFISLILVPVFETPQLIKSRSPRDLLVLRDVGRRPGIYNRYYGRSAAVEGARLGPQLHSAFSGLINQEMKGGCL